MKKYFYLVAALLILLVGCDSDQTDSKIKEVKQSVDDRFLTALAEGLNKRWQYADVGNGIDDSKESLTKVTKFELNELEGMQEADFEDDQLKEYAVKYIEELNNGLKLLNNYELDIFFDDWETHERQRNDLLYKISAGYGIKVDEKYRGMLPDLTIEGKVLPEDDPLYAELQDLLAKTEFKGQESEGDDWKSYQADIVNTTTQDIIQFSAVVNLLDDKGEAMDSLYIDTANWLRDEKAVFEIATDKDFSEMEFAVASVSVRAN